MEVYFRLCVKQFPNLELEHEAGKDAEAAGVAVDIDRSKLALDSVTVPHILPIFRFWTEV